MHPKDRISDKEKYTVSYKPPLAFRKSQRWFIRYRVKIERVHVGETGRPLGARVKECRKEVDSITGIFTRAEKTRAASICNKSAITDHVCNENRDRLGERQGD